MCSNEQSFAAVSLQEDAWAASLLDGEDEWATELRDDEDGDETADDAEYSFEDAGPGLPPSLLQ